MPDRKIFHDSVAPLPAEEEPFEGAAPGAPPAAPRMRRVFRSAAPPAPAPPPPSDDALTAAPDQSLKLLFSLEMPGDTRKQLQDLVARGETISPEDLRSKFAVSKADVDRLADWLKAQGFVIDYLAPHNSGVYSTGTIKQIESSLGVRMVPVRRNGETFMAAEGAPSLPGEIGNPVRAIVGLQPFRQIGKHGLAPVPKKNRSKLSASGKLTPNLANKPPYLVSEILKAYDADGLPHTGEGQTIAVIIDSFPGDRDIKAFWKANRIAGTVKRLEKVNTSFLPPFPPTGEETLDVQWSSGIAPGATIRIYATGTLQLVALTNALDMIIDDLATQPGLRQVSMSLGSGETYLQQSRGEIDTQAQKFLLLAAVGVNVFASSGDGGSSPGKSPHDPPGPLQAQYQASDPMVIGVGGTSLTLADDGSVAEETGWQRSGGGKSIFFERPHWQVNQHAPPGSERLVPDVSAVADDQTGAFMVFEGKPVSTGGTSWSAPVWAGFCALINEARQKAGKPLLPHLNPLLYPLAGSPCFRAIEKGSNGDYTAGPGYNMVTGLGVPHVKELIKTLTQ